MAQLKPSTVEPSLLTPGAHPAFLVAHMIDDTPADWVMFANSPRRFVWCFAVWESVQDLYKEPELLTTYSSTKYTPKRRNPASKSYLWACALTRLPLTGNESLDLDPLLPLPCVLDITRTDSTGATSNFSTIEKLNAWADGMQVLTPDYITWLMQWWNGASRLVTLHTNTVADLAAAANHVKNMSEQGNGHPVTPPPVPAPLPAPGPAPVATRPGPMLNPMMPHPAPPALPGTLPPVPAPPTALPPTPEPVAAGAGARKVNW